MKTKKLHKNRIIISMLFLLTLSVLFGIINMPATQTFAGSETLEQKIERFTSSDLLDGEQEGGIDIRTFATKYKKNEYCPTDYTSYYPITEIISKVLPLELFYTEGAHVYMGSEYGFIVYT